MYSGQKKNVTETAFTGFPPDTFRFLSDIGRHNTKQWFHDNYDRYRQSLVDPAKRFVVSIGEFVQLLNPRFNTEPKFNKTLMRIARDARFAKGKPYRDYFLIGFHRWKWDSELFLYLDKRGMEIGLFINNKKKRNQPSLKHVLATNEAFVIDVCDEYGIDNRYTLSELGGDMNTVSKRFDVRKHKTYLRDLKMIIISKYFTPKGVGRLKEKIVGEAIRHFSTLYPLWILAESPRPENDLRRHDEKLGPVRGVS
jgi:hypothetical protein